MKRLQMIAAIEDEKVDNLEGTVQERETLKKVRQCSEPFTLLKDQRRHAFVKRDRDMAFTG